MENRYESCLSKKFTNFFRYEFEIYETIHTRQFYKVGHMYVATKQCIKYIKERVDSVYLKSDIYGFLGLFTHMKELNKYALVNLSIII